MLQIKSWFEGWMWRRGWVPHYQFRNVFEDRNKILRELNEALAELRSVDMVLVHRPALDHRKTRTDKIVHAIFVAGQYDVLKAKIGNIENREARIKQLEVGNKAIPSKVEDIRQHLLDTDNEKASEIKYRALKKRTREVVDNAVKVAKYLRRLSMMEGRGNEDVARLQSAAELLYDPHYHVSLPDVAKYGAKMEGEGDG